MNLESSSLEKQFETLRTLSDAPNHFTSYVVFDLEKVKRNVLYLRDLIPRDKKLIAVVKGNAYGHGAIEVARVALDNGASMLAVARIGDQFLKIF